MTRAAKDDRKAVRQHDLGAASHAAADWDQIVWQQCTANVNRLQARIVKAIEAGRWNRARSLQRLLTHSFSGRALAVKRVTENRGKRTPGVDGRIWRSPAQKATAVHDLRQHGYRAQPLRRVYIEKPGSTKKRPLGIPVMKDRAMQALHLFTLAPLAEVLGDENSYGFRPGRSAADALRKCHALLARSGQTLWVLEGDIRSCFDEISHQWLLDHIPMDRQVLQQWLKAGFMDKSALHPTRAGTPQGGIASPVLANMVLDGLQARLRERFPVRRCRAQNRVHLVRYADDFIVTGDSKEILEQEVRPLVEQFMRERGLSLSPQKTVVTNVDEGFDFLGQTVRRQNGKLLTKPSKKSVKRFLSQVREIIRRFATAPAGVLVHVLNPKIRGWINYHRHGASSRIFGFVDNAIWQALWRWAVRRHPGKSKRWVKDKYFPARRGRSWNFTGWIARADGTKEQVVLIKATDLPIRRHVLVKGKANPFDPRWEEYYRERRLRRARDSFHDKQHLAPPPPLPRGATSPAKGADREA
jgi:RNA-directed DNA polymerase